MIITILLFCIISCNKNKFHSIPIAIETEDLEDNSPSPQVFEIESEPDAIYTPEENILEEKMLSIKNWASSISDRKNSLKNTFIDITLNTEEKHTPYFQVSEYNRNVLIHILFFESCSNNTKEQIQEQYAIISVIFNRLNSNNYEHCYDVSDIIFFKYPNGSYAFSPAANKDRFWNFQNQQEREDFNRNYQQLADAVDYVINNGPTIPPNVLYFLNINTYNDQESSGGTYFRNNHCIYTIYDNTIFLTTEKP